MPYSRVNNEYSIYRVQDTPSSAYTQYSIHPVQHTPSAAYTQYNIHQVLHTPSTAYTKYSIHQVQHTPSTVYTKYSIHWVQHTLSSAFTKYSKHQAQHPPKIVCLPFILTITSWPLNIASAPGIPSYMIDHHRAAHHECSIVKSPYHIPTVASWHTYE